MTASASARRPDLPGRVHVCVGAVTVGALLLLPVSRLATGAVSGPAAVFDAVILAVLIAVANRRPVDIGPKRKVNVATAPEVAAVLLLSGPVAALTLAAGTIVGEAGRQARLVQRVFNVAVAVLRALAGTAVYVSVHRLGPPELAEPVAAVAAAVALYGGGTLVVLGVAAVQLRQNPLRGAWAKQRDLLVAEAALSLTGIMAGLAAAQHPWALALLVAPAVLAQRALRDAEARYRRIFEHAVEGIFQLGPDGRFQAANPAAARMLGYGTARDMLAEVHDLRQLFVDGDAQQAYQRLLDARGEVTNFETPMRCRDGGELWVSLNARAVRAPGGGVLSIEGLMSDITERKRAEAEREQLLRREQEAREAAEAANRAKDEFLSLLSHELRTPLTAILGFIAILQRKKRDEVTVANALAAIERGARVQARLVADILDVSRIVAGKLQLDPRPAELRSIVAAAVEAVQPAADEKQITVAADLDPSVGIVRGDAVRLQQVVGNLLTNAVKFTPEGGRVDVRLARAGAEACITVTDTGMGIPADFLPHVFERFRQADASSSRSYGGLGLGLAIAHHLVERHGGRIAVGSDGEGRGATFTVRLPLLAAPVQSSVDDGGGGTARDASSGAPVLTGVRVLGVEDTDDTRDFRRIVLEGAGAAVTTAASSAEGWAALEATRPDVVVADIGLPGEDGYSFIARVRARPAPAGGDIPAIALTAYAGSEDRHHALAAGFHRHMTKPVDPPALIAAVAELARQPAAAVA